MKSEIRKASTLPRRIVRPVFEAYVMALRGTNDVSLCDEA